ncbi:MAG: transposase [Candidatus Nealsonbacteria bacterium]
MSTFPLHIENRKTQPLPRRNFYISAKNKYTFAIFCGILLAKLITKGGHHENRPGPGCPNTRRRVDSLVRRWSILNVYKRSCRAKKDPNGGSSRTQRLDHRTNLSTFQLQNPKILLRHPTPGLGKQHRCLVAQKNRTQKTPETNLKIGKTSYSTAPDHRQKHVRYDARLEPRRLRCQIACGGTNFKRLWHQQKKTASKHIKERSRALLTPEVIEVLDNALKPKPIEVTRQSLHTDLEALLKRGFTTTHAGGFFFIPYLMELDLYKNLPTLSMDKTTGIPNEKIALQLIWEPLLGYSKGIRKVDPVSQTDFGALSGLPFICSASTEYRFLSQSSIEDSENFQKTTGKQLKVLDYINGDVINMDGHSIKLFSRKEMKASYLSKDKTYGKAIRAFYTQDQASKKPLFAKVAYSGATVAQITPQLVEANKEILGGPFLSVNDKEWFIGSLLEQLDKIHGIQVLLPVKRTPKRLREMKAIPFEKFKYRYHSQPVAKLVTDLDGFTGQMRMFVKQNDDETFFALITNKKYFRVASVMEYYEKRWRIENFFNENMFLGLDHLPSLELNAIQTSLTLKMVSFHLIDNFRKNLPEPFNTMKPESIYQNFIQGVQGKAQVKKDKLQVDIYGFKHQDIVAPLFKNLEQKLIAQDIDPRCPWLNEYPLTFSFK